MTRNEVIQFILRMLRDKDAAPVLLQRAEDYARTYGITALELLVEARPW